MNISYEQIRSFVAVAETGSFSAAAKQLHKHRTTLGEVIRNLEIEVNMTLFERKGKYPVLTEQGQALFRHAKSLNDNAQAFESLCLSIESGVESDLKLYHSELLPRALMSVTMQDIRPHFPHVNVHWLHKNTDEVRTGLHSGDADLGIVLLDSTSQGASATDYIHLMSMPFSLVASPRLFNEPDSTVSIAMLKASRQLILEDCYHSELKRSLIVSPIVQRIENSDFLIELLLLNEGWSIMPSHTVQDEIDKGLLLNINVKELNTTLRFPLAIWYMNHAQIGPVRSHIIQSLCRNAKQHEGQPQHK